MLAVFPVFNTHLSLAAGQAETQPPSTTTTTSVPSNDPGLPDLGKPGAAKGGVNVSAGPSGARIESRFDQQKIILAPEYSNQTGLSLGAGYATLFSNAFALGLLFNVGEDKHEALINAGWQLDERQRFILSAGQLWQKLDYSFRSGTDKAGMTQNSGGLSYQYQLGQGTLRSIEANGYFARTASRDLDDRTFATDTATLFELWNDPRRIAGGTVAGFQGKLGVSPIEGSLVKFSLGQERLSWDLLVGNESTNRLTGGIEWFQQLSAHTQFKLAAESYASQNRYSAGFERTVADSGSGRHALGLGVTNVQGREGIGNDTQVKLTWNYVFGNSPAGTLPMSNASPRTALLAPAGSSDPLAIPAGGAAGLLDAVSQRPGYMPSHVLAKVDTTALPTRLIVVDKTGLPAGTTIDAATGDITTPLGVVVTGIAGVTRNGGAFANSTQFALSGNSLITRPSQIVQPAVGVTDTYVVTINNFGGGTTLATILVSHGSVKVDSIVVTAGGGGDTTPDAFTFVDQTNVALSTLTESAAITVAGINAAAAISVTGGEYQVNGGAWTSTAGTVTNGQTVKVRHTSSASNNTATNTVLTIGGVSDTFTSTTVAALPAGYIQQGGLTWTPNTIGSASFGGDFGGYGLPGGYNNWNTANTYCTTTTINGQTGWRLPTQPELSALYASGQLAGQPGWALIDTWSSTPNGAGIHYNVTLDDGDVDSDSDALSAYVSCVR